MKVTDKKVDELNYELTVQIDARDYEAPYRKRFTDTRKRAEFKGFRKGMVPASLIERVYGSQILADSVNDVLSEQINKYITDSKLNILGEPLSSENQPEIEWKNGNAFTFVFDLAVSPEVGIDLDSKDTVTSYSISITEKTKEEMKKNLAKYYEEHKDGEQKSEEDIDKEVTDRLTSEYAQESQYRLSSDIREYLVNKSGVKLPEAFLKRWLLRANEGKVTAEDVEKDFDGFAKDFKWQLVRGALMKKYDLKVAQEDILEAAKSYVTFQYAMYGMGNVPAELIDDAVKNILSDRNQAARMEEQVEDGKVLAKVKEVITIKEKKITAEKYRELK